MTTRYAILRHGRSVGDYPSLTEAELRLQVYVPVEYQPEYRIEPINIEDPDDEC